MIVDFAARLSYEILWDGGVNSNNDWVSLTNFTFGSGDFNVTVGQQLRFDKVEVILLGGLSNTSTIRRSGYVVLDMQDTRSIRGTSFPF